MLSNSTFKQRRRPSLCSLRRDLELYDEGRFVEMTLRFDLVFELIMWRPIYILWCNRVETSVLFSPWAFLSHSKRHSAFLPRSFFYLSWSVSQSPKAPQLFSPGSFPHLPRNVTHVGSPVILCLHSKHHLWKEGMHPSLVPRLMYSVSHVFCVSYIPASHVFLCLMYSGVSCIPYLMYPLSHILRVSCSSTRAQTVPQPYGGADRVSTFRPCLESCLDFKPRLTISHA